MNSENVKEFLKWAIPCIKYYNYYSGKKREQVKNKWHDIKNYAYKGLETGIIEEDVLKKGWCMAYPRIMKLIEKGIKNPMKKYMFSVHNELVNTWCEVRVDANFCFALVGQVLKKYNNKVIVNILDKEREIINTCKAKKDDYIGIHYWDAIEIITKEEFNKYNELIKKYDEYV